jgi:hypothetical protein
LPTIGVIIGEIEMASMIGTATTIGIAAEIVSRETDGQESSARA